MPGLLPSVNYIKLSANMDDFITAPGLTSDLSILKGRRLPYPEVDPSRSLLNFGSPSERNCISLLPIRISNSAKLSEQVASTNQPNRMGIPVKPPRKTILKDSQGDCDFKKPQEIVRLIATVKEEMGHLNKVRKGRSDFNGPSLRQNTAPDVKVQEKFIAIRNGWMKRAKAVENLQWTLGNHQVHARRVEKHFLETKARAKSCDVSIKTADGQTFRSHALILAAHSKAFEKRLLSMNPGTAIPGVYRLHLTDKVSGSMVAKAIDWMYRGYTRTPANLLPELTKVARYFQIIPLLMECLRRKLSAEALHHDLNQEPLDSRPTSSTATNCDTNDDANLPSPDEELRRLPEPVSARSRTSAMRTIHLPKLPANSDGNQPPTSAEHPKESNLADEVTKNSAVPSNALIKETNLQKEGLDNSAPKNGQNDELEADTAENKEEPDTTGAADIMTLPPEELEKVLSDNDLDIESELEVLDVIMRWIRVAPVQREIYITQLLNCVRFYHLSNDQLKLCFQLHPSYFNIPLFRNLLGAAFRAKALLLTGKPIPVDFNVLPSRCRKNSTDLSYPFTSIIQRLF